ncbi:hypothetical protein A2363_03415 [Candidatus Gottesmanbacteria bacterium RIFOXYB1_FULL_47_11]|uniref:Uncharacterized protein n=1 Tax=Candidatus Gottesmanbacteria bacterium RIFOXYB1_FULL_47_11 TaxID=1798401 RepID=A0A1F6BF25_9BACT|nr:MAG: hypothetical protein A2363_03415 [Candidatus Gottesmanbacteria bacterium RIFOXYB1_FULL_47_11]
MNEHGNEFMGTNDALNAYSHLVGLESRRYPALRELPLIIDIPIEYLGDASRAISLTRNDGLERAQFIKYKNGIITKSPIEVGTSTSVKIPVTNYDIFLGEKALLDYHVHPGFDDRLSVEDFRFNRSIPRASFITAVFSYDGGTFIFQTDKSAKLPLSLILRAVSSKRKYAQWNEVGFGYYTFDRLPDPNWATENSLNIHSLRINRLNHFFSNY